MAGLPGDTASFVAFQVTSLAGRKSGRLLIGPAPLAAKSWIDHHAVFSFLFCCILTRNSIWGPENLSKKVFTYMEVYTKFSSFIVLPFCPNPYPAPF